MLCLCGTYPNATYLLPHAICHTPHTPSATHTPPPPQPSNTILIVIQQSSTPFHSNIQQPSAHSAHPAADSSLPTVPPSLDLGWTDRSNPTLPSALSSVPASISDWSDREGPSGDGVGLNRPKVQIEPVVTLDTRNDVSAISWSYLSDVEVRCPCTVCVRCPCTVCVCCPSPVSVVRVIIVCA